ncbi:MAG: cyclase family protein [Clostridium argentinense]|uniref:Cyclase family protein n=1 Tax=Clostridium faecium TaxID=2762223 RepID=A0ABR8YSE0_9CLOT|nr:MULTISPECIES: cyclase family protein [Clostridium]MBD8047134.1 cyclase family protein [Clostridium faecium]MBS5823575.1 cyclase family protein [Clostridium argentinense]MDU1349593.1 cyclase family protein [Clostridium argentinense]
MKIDLTVKISKEMWNKLWNEAADNKKMTLLGHIGTHFDVMDKEFSLDNTIRNGKAFDVSHIKNREIEAEDIDVSSIEENDFVMFYTGTLKERGYGTKEYFTNYPELSEKLIQNLIDKKVSIIGIDTAGIRKPSEHVKTDQYCADNNVFVIENLDNLNVLLNDGRNKNFKVHTYPINIEGMSGLCCRVVAEV